MLEFLKNNPKNKLLMKAIKTGFSIFCLFCITSGNTQVTKQKISKKTTQAKPVTACFTHYIPVDSTDSIIVFPRLSGNLFSFTKNNKAVYTTITEHYNGKVSGKELLQPEKNAKKKILINSALHEISGTIKITADTLFFAGTKGVLNKVFLITYSKEGDVGKLTDMANYDVYLPGACLPGR